MNLQHYYETMRNSNNSNQSDLKKKTTSLPAKAVEYLKNWMMSPEHIAHPYPTEKEKSKIMADTGIELKQLTNWFVNNRKRYWKPRVEARLKQQTQGQNGASVPGANHQRGNDNRGKITLLLLDVKVNFTILRSQLFVFVSLLQYDIIPDPCR